MKVLGVWMMLVLLVVAPGLGQSQSRKGKPSIELPAGMTEKLDVVYAQYGERKMHLDLFALKATDKAKPAIVVVHGGGWLKGDKSKFRALAIALASKGYVTAAIEYRLGGEAKFPAAIHDCNAAVRFLRAHADKYDLNPKQIGVVGGSAGGHLAGLMATAGDADEFQGAGGNTGVSSAVQSCVVMAGPLDLASGSVVERSRKEPEKSNANQWFGKTFDQDPELYRQASPFHHLGGNTPPMLFMCGDKDKPQRNQTTREKLDALGVKNRLIVVKDGKHGCWNRLPWFDGFVTAIDQWFQDTL